AAPLWPFAFRTTTRVFARGRTFEGAGFAATGLWAVGLGAALAPWVATECPSMTVPPTISASNSSAATPLATSAAVRQGRMASNGTACSTGASSSLAGAGFLQALPRQSQAVRERLLGAPAQLTFRQARIGDAAANVAGPSVRMDRLAVDAGDAPADGVELVDR